MSDTLIQQVTYETFSITNGDTVLHEILETEILEQGIMGPPGPVGPQGPAGPPGVGTSSPWQEAIFTVSSDQTVFVLPAVPASNTVSLFTNGLRETNDNFSVTGATITVTGFVPTTGDVVSIVFQ